MDYDTAVAGFFAAPPDARVPGPVASGSPARRLRDALEPVAMHAVWSARVNAALAGHGYDFFSGYVTGRAAPLGEVPSAVVASAFGVFEPALIDAMWSAGRALLPLPELITVRDNETAASLREVLDGEDVGGVADVLERAVDAVDGTGRPLFSALRAQPRLPDPFGRLWRATDLVREHRGDGHLAACVAAGLDPVRMGVLAETWVGYPVGEYSGTRGWPQARQDAAAARLEADGLLADGEITDTGRALRDAIEAATDASQQALLEGVGADLEEITTRLHAWSERCVEAKQFPPDPRKRAAG
ncbi:MAG: hypothetical protein OJJ54_18590 [Pseudonocardia sp.]|nr:hypothetical protein [Pseudonocardia sp.]